MLPGDVGLVLLWAASLQHQEVVFHGDPAWVDVEPHEQVADGQRPVELVRVAVQRDGHEALILTHLSQA